MLFEQLAGDFELIGITAVRTGLGEGAELELHDRLARYYSPRWFLNQFHCRLELGLCSEDVDDLVEQSIIQDDVASKLQLLAIAHRQLVETEVFIPLGAPVRWSLVRGDITGFEENTWGIHPLFPLSQPPT
jgi:ABC-type oligopeptide transport system substrate-binding subunit